MKLEEGEKRALRLRTTMAVISDFIHGLNIGDASLSVVSATRIARNAVMVADAAILELERD